MFASRVIICGLLLSISLRGRLVFLCLARSLCWRLLEACSPLRVGEPVAPVDALGECIALHSRCCLPVLPSRFAPWMELRLCRLSWEERTKHSTPGRCAGRMWRDLGNAKVSWRCASKLIQVPTFEHRWRTCRPMSARAEHTRPEVNAAREHQTIFAPELVELGPMLAILWPDVPKIGRSLGARTSSIWGQVCPKMSVIDRPVCNVCLHVGPWSNFQATFPSCVRPTSPGPLAITRKATATLGQPSFRGNRLL